MIILALSAYVVHNEVTQLKATPKESHLAWDSQSMYSVGPEVNTFDLPMDYHFAGEPVPLHDLEVKERLDRELHVNVYYHSSTVFNIKRAGRWLNQMEPILKSYGVPQDFKYLAIIESGLMNVKSPRGAVGFWQIMEETGKELGLEVNEEVDERYDPIKSTEAACKFLLKGYSKFGNWTNTAASYNMGMSGLKRSINDQKVGSYYDLLLNEETSRYLFRIMALKMIMEQPAKFGYNVPEEHLYKPEPIKEIKVNATIPDLVDFAFAQGINYKILKQYNPWLRKKTLTVKKPGKTYTILVPLNPPKFEKSLNLLSFDTLGMAK